MIGRSRLIDVAVRVFRLFDNREDDDLPIASRLAGAQSFLVLRYEIALGSAVSASSVFEALRRVRPDAFIAVACNRLCFDVLKGNPFIDKLILTADPPEHFGRAARDALWAVWRGGRRFDCLITSGDGRRKIEALALLLGRGLKIGHGPARTYDIALNENPALSVSADHLRAIELFGAIGTPPVPRLYAAPSDEAVISEKLVRLGWNGVQPLFVFASQGSGGQPTEWPDERFVAVADRLADGYGARIVFTGSAGQRTAIDRLCAAMRHASVNLAGETTLAELAALIAKSRLVVTLDTGTMHLAAGARVPMVVIASAWQPAHLWLPLGNDHAHVLRRDHVPCALCGKFYCATRECLDEITVDDVVAAAAEILARIPAGNGQAVRSIPQGDRR
jgi:ADP-heptose:LPS heptosyltransferase